MSGEDEFRPHLGRLRDLGASSGKRVGRRLRRALGRLGNPGRKSRFTGARYGTGGAARSRRRVTDHLARHRIRRVIVKVHIARAGEAGPDLYRAHISYLRRDGVDRDGEGGQVYDREREGIDAKGLVDRSARDPHQFRIIVSPEDGVHLGDLKPAIRDLMAQVERDTGRRLDWIAVDHHNTGHPHTHIVVRGRDYQKRDVVIAKDYLMRGIREAAEDIVTRRLGPRRDLDILRARQSEVSQDRLTGIDAALAKAHPDGRVRIGPARSEGERFERHLRLARLRHLESLALADRTGPDAWTLKPGWTDALREATLRGDIIRTMARTYGQAREDLDFAASLPPGAPPISGTVSGYGPEDELRDTRFLLVEDFSGRIWHVPARAVDAADAPPAGAVVEITRGARKPGKADRTIAAIADRTGGVWSDELHAQSDPDSSPAYRLAHKRRLEALRRAGIVVRAPDGSWAIPDDFLERAAEYETARAGGVRLRTLSWLSMEHQATARAEAWIDTADLTGDRFETHRRARLEHLRREGLLDADQERLTDAQRSTLRQDELRRAIAAHAARTGRQPVDLPVGDRFRGTLEGHVDLAQGRMAIIGSGKAFVMVPWRDGLGRQLGQRLMLERTARGMGWAMGAEARRLPPM